MKRPTLNQEIGRPLAQWQGSRVLPGFCGRYRGKAKSPHASVSGAHRNFSFAGTVTCKSVVSVPAVSLHVKFKV